MERHGTQWSVASGGARRLAIACLGLLLVALGALMTLAPPLGARRTDPAAGGDSAAAAPVDDFPRGGSPAVEFEFAQDVIPFPADALTVGRIVGGEV